MYNGIGLQTARGSGTNGYVHTNKFFIRSSRRTTGGEAAALRTRAFEVNQGTGGITNKPNSDILEHDRKRQIELKLVVLEDQLIDQGFTDSEISEKVGEARSNLEASLLFIKFLFSNTQSHQIAARKEKQMEALRAVLGIAKTSDEQLKCGLSGGKRDQKPEHSFLDRDFSWKKSTMVDEDPKDGKKRSINGGSTDAKHSKKRRQRRACL